MSEEIKRKAKELANKAYWRTRPNNVSQFEVSDPNVEEILQEAMLWAEAQLKEQIIRRIIDNPKPQGEE